MPSLFPVTGSQAGAVIPNRQKAHTLSDTVSLPDKLVEMRFAVTAASNVVITDKAGQETTLNFPAAGVYYETGNYRYAKATGHTGTLSPVNTVTARYLVP